MTTQGRLRTNSATGKQGSFDGLCGVYAVVNSAALLVKKPMTNSNARELFAVLIRKIDDDQMLLDSVVHGILFRHLGQLIDVASEHLRKLEGGFILERKVAFRRQPEALGDYWQRLKGHLSQNRRSTAIIGTSGKHDHWTCATKISDSQIDLRDSSSIKQLKRSHCTIGNPKIGRPHGLWPTQTYLLRSVDG
jgi:hypothetical protein